MKMQKIGKAKEYIYQAKEESVSFLLTYLFLGFLEQTKERLIIRRLVDGAHNLYAYAFDIACK